MTSRTLSARHTFLLKYVLPPLWVIGVGAAVWQVWSSTGTTTATKLLVVLAFILGLGVLLAFAVPLKRVDLEAEGLRISNGRREILVPFTAIAQVRQAWLPTFRQVTLDLRSETPFGRRIIFRPALPQPFAFWRRVYWREDELVKDLRALAGLPAPK